MSALGIILFVVLPLAALVVTGITAGLMWEDLLNAIHNRRDSRPSSHSN